MNESKTLEFKRNLSSTFLKTVSAYANYGTGRIVFGVADDGTVVGIDDIDSARLSIEDKINDSLSPVPKYSLDADRKAGTITLTVSEGKSKPYLYRAKAYRRADTSTVEVDRLELNRLLLEGMNLSFEDTAARRQDLSFSYLEQKLKGELGISALTDDILRTLDLKDGNTFNVAGELLADVNTFPGIDMVRFGDSISILLDRETCEGRSVLEELDAALSFFRRYYLYEQVEGALRREKALIPVDAFREAVANALVHRQWDVNAHIRISMFSDCVEVASPGGLPRGLTEREYLDGQVSVLRNPKLGTVFFRLHIIERFGTGVLRIRECYEGSVRQPSFEVYENSIKVVLPILEDDLSLSDDERAVYQVVKGRDVPISFITSQLPFGKSKASQILARLAERGYVQINGNGRGTTYAAH